MRTVSYSLGGLPSFARRQHRVLATEGEVCYLRLPCCVVCCHYGDYGNANCFFSEPWCGLLSSCPAQEGESVTIGCYARYQWLATLLQYNPVVTILSSVEFVEEPASRVESTPALIPPGAGPPTPEIMMSNYTIPNLSAGQQLNYTCQIQYRFTGRGYSPRNDYANNTLSWSRCSITESVVCKYMLHGVSTLKKQISEQNSQQSFLFSTVQYRWCVRIGSQANGHGCWTSHRTVGVTLAVTS